MLWRAGWSVKWSATATLLYAMIRIGIILAAALAAACGGPEPSPIDSASSAEEILAEAEAAMAQVESFASVYEWTIGDTETVTTENEFQDERNYRKTRSMSTEGVLFIGPSEVAVVDGETFWNSADTWSDSPPAYAFPSDLGDIERLDDTMLEGARVHHLRGSRPPSGLTESGVTTSDWTFDMLIDADTLLLVRSEGRTTLTFPPQGASTEEQSFEGFSVAAYGRFGEDFNIVPPGPTPTPTPDPTPTPRPSPTPPP